jgi:hypothetical protein
VPHIASVLGADADPGDSKLEDNRTPVFAVVHQHLWDDWMASAINDPSRLILTPAYPGQPQMSVAEELLDFFAGDEGQHAFEDLLQRIATAARHSTDEATRDSFEAWLGRHAERYASQHAPVLSEL